VVFIFKVGGKMLTVASSSNSYFVELCQNLPKSSFQPFIQIYKRILESKLYSCVKNFRQTNPYKYLLQLPLRWSNYIYWQFLFHIPANGAKAWGRQGYIEVTWRTSAMASSWKSPHPTVRSGGIQQNCECVCVWTMKNPGVHSDNGSDDVQL
jgi:hypothetical protein